MRPRVSSTTRLISATILVLFSLMRTSGAEATVVFPGADWAEATPESRGINAAKLKAAVADLERGFGPEGAAELVIVRDGYLIWKGPQCDAYHPIFSCTKVFTSTMLGLLADDGRCNPGDLAIRYLPALDDGHPEYARLTLGHLATMTGGYQGLVRGVSAEQPWGDLVGYLAPQSPRYEPGTACAYHDHDVFLLGNILTRLAGESLAAVFNRRIADPIGMTRWNWGVAGTLDNGIPLNNVAGTPARSPGIQTTARELTRFGHLCLNRGLWNGRQLLSTSFIEKATSTQVPASLAHASGADPAGHYGFYWWTNGRQRGGAQPWPEAPARTYAAQGGSGNFCFVIPEWNMVVVRLGTNALTRSAATDDLWSRFFGQIGDAMRSRADTVSQTGARDAQPPAEPLGVQRSTTEAELPSASAVSHEFPPVSELPSRVELPDPLIMFDGRRVTTREQWFNERRPELITLFQHYMYGFMPPPPGEVTSKIEREDRHAFDGKATLKEVTVMIRPPELSPIHLMLIVPNRRQGPAPVILAMNYFGNHTLVRDPVVRLSTSQPTHGR